MPRRAKQPAAPKFRTAEETGTRPKERLCAELPRLSPCLHARQLLDAGRVRDALEILEREIADGKETAELQLWLGRAAFRLGDHARAQRALSRAVTLSPHDAEMHRWLARVLLYSGDTSAAARVMGRASHSSLPPLFTPAAQLSATDLEGSEDEDPPTVVMHRRRP